MDLIIVKTIFFGILGFGEIGFGNKMVTVIFLSDLQNNKYAWKEITLGQAMTPDSFPTT